MTDKQIIDGISNFCLVCYYDNKTKELVRIEQYNDNDTSIYADIESYKYGYNAEIVKPEQLIKQLKIKEKELEFWQKEGNRTHLLMLEKQDELVKEILKNDQLEAEKKELKTCYKNNLEVLRHEEKVNNNLTDRCMKAEKALQEIKDYCNKYSQNSIGFKQQILQKCEVIKDEV